MSVIEEIRGVTARLRRRARMLAMLATVPFVVPALGQTPAPGWILIVRAVPNPLPIGRCAGVTVELQDDEGYRRNELSNGGVIDFHKFRYDVDTTNFQWQNGDPLNGALCTRASATPSNVTLTVTLPDGLSGSVQLTSKAVGEYAAAVQYAKQGPLKRPGVPPPHASTITQTAAASGAAPGGVATSSPPSEGSSPTTTSSTGGGSAPTRTSGASSRSTASGITTTTALSMTGAYAAIQPVAVTTTALTMIGAYAAIQPMTVVTPSLSMTGGYSTVAAQVVTTSALSMTGGFAASGQLVTTSALSMIGGYAAIAPQIVDTPALTMTGTGP